MCEALKIMRNVLPKLDRAPMTHLISVRYILDHISKTTKYAQNSVAVLVQASQKIPATKMHMSFCACKEKIRPEKIRPKIRPVYERKFFSEVSAALGQKMFLGYLHVRTTAMLSRSIGLLPS